MKFRNVFLLLFTLTPPAQALEVIEPGVTTARFEISSPDDTVATLGKVSFILDLSAQHDNLLELQIRRKGLTLADGRPVTAFGYNKESGIIVGSVAPVAHISVAGVQGQDVLTLFHNDNNEVLAPRKADIALFDLNFNPIGFDYQPATPPQDVGMNVSILIDRSGSMDTHMSSVMSATREFMANLPTFTRCHVLTFNDQVERLTQADNNKVASCPDSLWVINQHITPGGGTALFSALETALNQTAKMPKKLPHLIITITDGVNNQSSSLSFDELVSLKSKSNGKLFTFWAGSYDPTHLKGLADFESVSSSAIKNDLDMFFHSIGVSVSGIQTINIR